ncbi:MAG TPA: DUF2142 domain-containing protein [Verrucomicrobiae bacterium]|nr:DUF2142 domain-containing protein [Verrucomicrobiae bacterium]
MRIRHWLLLFGTVNAVLYSALLPLWEGFDEAYHYAYVESLWQTGRLPVLGRTSIPSDVLQSFQLAPVSHIVQKPIPEATSFDVWFSLPQAEKEGRRNRLDRLYASPALTTRGNYEAHQPPLAYALLAAFDWPMSHLPLPHRVLVLRIIGAICGIVLIECGTRRLCAVLQLAEPFANAVIFTIFCSQMLYATIAHVANDWLALGLGALFLAALAEFVGQPGKRSANIAALLFAAALLTKAYFLVFAPLAMGVALVLLWQRRIEWQPVATAGLLVAVLAGPWYARNLALYGSLGGTVEATEGVGARQALAAAPHIDWVATAGYLARSSLWTGNNSFTSFSRVTLDIVLILLLAAVLMWAFRVREIRPTETFLFAGMVLFAAAIAYQSCVVFAFTNGLSSGASPWYSQILLPPVIAIAYLGMARAPRRWRSPLAAGTIVLWTWVLVATWVVKLFPMYSTSTPVMRLHDLWAWYTRGLQAGDLALLALAPPALLYAGLAAVLIVTVSLGVSVSNRLVTFRNEPAA